MPQAPDLETKFEDDSEAFDVLQTNFIITRQGIICRKDKTYVPNSIESDAVFYLVFEWDYSTTENF